MNRKTVILILVSCFWLYLPLQFVFIQKIEEPFPAITYPGFAHHSLISRPKEPIEPLPKYVLFAYNNTDSTEVSLEKVMHTENSFFISKAMDHLIYMSRHNFEAKPRTLNVSSRMQLVFRQRKMDDVPEQLAELRSWFLKRIKLIEPTFSPQRVKLFTPRAQSNRTVIYRQKLEIDL